MVWLNCCFEALKYQPELVNNKDLCLTTTVPHAVCHSYYISEKRRPKRSKVLFHFCHLERGLQVRLVFSVKENYDFWNVKLNEAGGHTHPPTDPPTEPRHGGGDTRAI